MRWVSAMPAIVMAAFANDLNPAIEESNRILGVSTAQWRQVDLQTQLQTMRLDVEQTWGRLSHITL